MQAKNKISKKKFYVFYVNYTKMQISLYITRKYVKNCGSLEGESPEGFLRTQNPKLS